MLDAQTPDTLTKGNHATHAGDLADLGEGNITALVGYLYFVQVTGAETTNCQLTGPDATDFHVGIGFDAAEAQRLRDGQTPSPADFKRLQRTSVVVEMTPHYRARYHPTWTRDAVNAIVGRQVKVVGQLMVDTEHANTRDNCAHPEADTNKCWRASMGATSGDPVVRLPHWGDVRSGLPRVVDTGGLALGASVHKESGASRNVIHPNGERWDPGR